MKSCSGTCFQILAGLCCVIFKTPSSARANFDLMYLRHASAELSSSNAPIVMKVCVTATPGGIRGDEWLESAGAVCSRYYDLEGMEAIRPGDVIAGSQRCRLTDETEHLNVVATIVGLSSW